MERKPCTTTGSEETVELILRTEISVNQLSIYGAVADLCNELDPDYAESVICKSLVIPTESVNANSTSLLRAQHHRYRETCCKIMFEKFAELPED